MFRPWLTVTLGKDVNGDKEKILRMALKSVLIVAQRLNVDLEDLIEAAIQEMQDTEKYKPEDVAEAGVLIEDTVDSIYLE